MTFLLDAGCSDNVRPGSESDGLANRPRADLGTALARQLSEMMTQNNGTKALSSSQMFHSGKCYAYQLPYGIPYLSM